WLAAAVVGPSAVVTTAWAQPGMPPLDPPSVKQQIQDGRRVFEANSVPAHPIGDFPNRHDPVPIRPQSLRLEMPQQPVIADKTSPGRVASSTARLSRTLSTSPAAATWTSATAGGVRRPSFPAARITTC